MLLIVLGAWTSPDRQARAADATPTAELDARQAVNAAINRGVAFLLARQNPAGSWGSAHRTKELNIYAPPPGAHQAFQTGVTSLCIMALLEIGGGPDVQASIDRGENWLIEHVGELRRANGDALYNVWGHSYAIQALVRMLARRPDDAPRVEKIRQLIASQVDRLRRYEFVDGGWGYYDFGAQTQKPSGASSSFTTATALIALHEAKRSGVEVPQGMIDRAVASVRRQRRPDFAYLYGDHHRYRPQGEVNCPGGSLGRSQVCNLATLLWGDKSVTDTVLQQWLDRLLARNLWLDIGRKRPIPHEAWFKVAGYFFYYGHYYAALCVEQLPPDRRPENFRRLAAIIVPLQETDGSWWDFPLYDYHQPYGTAFALMTLSRCR